MRVPATLLALAIGWTLGMPVDAWSGKTQGINFDGGPSGGVYTTFATGIAELINEKMPSVRVVVEPSAGSVSNLLRVNSGDIDMAIAAASDIDRGKRGLLDEHPSPLTDVKAVSRLYGEYAQLAVLAGSPIKSLADLAGKRVAVGARGSGTLTAARRFFEGVGLWDKIKPQYASYDLAAQDFLSIRVDAVWQMVGYPSKSLKEISKKTPIRLIALGKGAKEAVFFEKHPYYLPGTIPAGTYQGVDHDVATFQDQAIWVVSKDLDPEFVYRALGTLFSAEGLKHMNGVHPIAQQLDVNEGRRAVTIPLHPGARRFWAERE